MLNVPSIERVLNRYGVDSYLCNLIANEILDLEEDTLPEDEREVMRTLHKDCTTSWCEEAQEPNSRCPVFDIAIQNHSPQIYETEEGYRCRDCSSTDALDEDCYGEIRCAIHSDPCPGCYSGDAP